MSKKKSVQSGILNLILLGSIIVAVVIFWYYNKQIESRQMIENENRKQTELLIDRIIEIKSDKYANIVRDNSAWDELVNFLSNYDTTWVEDNIGYMLEDYQATSVNIFDSIGMIYYQKISEDFTNFEFFNMTKKELVGLFKDTSILHYYQMKNNAVFEYFGAGIISSGAILNRDEKSQGYLFMSRLIDHNVLEDIQESLGDIEVGLVANLSDLNRLDIDINENNIITRELDNFQNQPVAYLYFVSKSLNSLGSNILKITLLLLIVFIFIIFVITATMYLKLIRPLKILTESIDNQDVNKISKLIKQESEYGKISQAIQDYITQKKELDNTNEALEQKRAEIIDKTEELVKINDDFRSQREDFRMLRDDYQSNLISNEQKDLEINDLKYQLSKMSKVLQSSKNELITINEFMNQRENELQDNNNQLIFNQNYSRMLQTILLQTVAPTTKIFKNCFRLYDSQDSIGNAFYYVKKIGDKIAASVGNCSPTAVPGVILSTITVTLLNSLFESNPEMPPNEILNKLRDGLQRTVGTDFYGKQRADSVCISLLIFDSETLQADYSAAGRQILLVREYKINTLKGDEISIGEESKGVNFQRASIQLQSSDILYLCTDGYDSKLPMQDKTSMVTTEKFRQAVLKNSVSPMEIQKQRLDEFVAEWRGHIGDVAIIGFSI